MTRARCGSTAAGRAYAAVDRRRRERSVAACQGGGRAWLVVAARSPDHEQVRSELLLAPTPPLRQRGRDGPPARARAGSARPARGQYAFLAAGGDGSFVAARDRVDQAAVRGTAGRPASASRPRWPASTPTAAARGGLSVGPSLDSRRRAGALRRAAPDAPRAVAASSMSCARRSSRRAAAADGRRARGRVPLGRAGQLVAAIAGASWRRTASGLRRCVGTRGSPDLVARAAARHLGREHDERV